MKIGNKEITHNNQNMKYPITDSSKKLATSLTALGPSCDNKPKIHKTEKWPTTKPTLLKPHHQIAYKARNWRKSNPVVTSCEYKPKIHPKKKKYNTIQYKTTTKSSFRKPTTISMNKYQIEEYYQWPNLPCCDDKIPNSYKR